MTASGWLTTIGVGVVVLGILVGVGIAWRYKHSIGWLASTLAIWIFMSAVFGYVYFRQIATPVFQVGEAPAGGAETEVTGAPNPSEAEPDSSSLRLNADSDGKFYVDGLVNGATVHFMIDPKSSLVVLRPQDARFAGIVLSPTQAQGSVQTTSSGTQGGNIVIYQLAIGPIRLVNVPGSLGDENAAFSVLGMSFLSRIGGFEVTGGTMTLHE